MKQKNTFPLRSKCKEKKLKNTFFCFHKYKTNIFKVTSRQQEFVGETKQKNMKKAIRTKNDNYFSFCFDAKNYAKGKNNKKLCHLVCMSIQNQT
jgi:hypothetical protein